MALLIIILAPVLVVLLARAFFLNARALKRDIDRRFDAVRIQLEAAANSTLDPLLKERTRQ